MTIRDIALGTNGDIDVSGQDLKLVSDMPALLQSVSIRLKFFMGEWFADLTVGVPYFQQIMVKNPDTNLIAQIFKNVLLGTPGVKSVLSLSLQYDPKARTLAVTFACDTDFGQFEPQTVVVKK